MIKEAIVKIVNKEDLTYEEAYAVMNEIMSGQTSATQNAAFLAALSTKSARAETTDEIAGCAAAMRAHATQVDTGLEVFEIVGTGGDNAHSFNISTTSALAAAAGGMKVAKHGNRAASSQCGTADCLEALGVNISQAPHAAGSSWLPASMLWACLTGSCPDRYGGLIFWQEGSSRKIRERPSGSPPPTG